jgi:uncharacterized membrane protein
MGSKLATLLLVINGLSITASPGTIMDKSRTETFSDGIFAIAATLLVLDFHAPALGRPLASYLVHLWPSFVAYSISFLLIGLIWANHHSMFTHFSRVDRMLLFLNVCLLADVALLPFPTGLLAQSLRSGSNLEAAAFFYGLTLTVGGVFFNAIWLYGARYKKLILTRTSKTFIHHTTQRFIIGPISYGLATVLSIFVPYLAIVCYVLLIIYYWLPPKGEPGTVA